MKTALSYFNVPAIASKVAPMTLSWIVNTLTQVGQLPIMRCLLKTQHMIRRQTLL